MEREEEDKFKDGEEEDETRSSFNGGGKTSGDDRQVVLEMKGERSRRQSKTNTSEVFREDYE